MDIKQLIDALHEYKRRQEALSPSRYIGLDLFRRYFPDLFKMSGPPGQDAATPQMLSVFEKLLSGAIPDDQEMQVAFGVSALAWKTAFSAADPVKKSIPDKLVIMTFDDSTIDHYQIACPLLESYGGNAVLFATEMEKGMFGAPGFWDKDLYMTWEQIKELSDRGHEVANHTLHHNTLFPESDDATIDAEVKGVEDRFEQYGIPKSKVIGYPMGPCDPRTESLLRDLGYKWGRGSAISGSPYRVGGSLYEPRWDSPMIIPSVFASSAESLRQAMDACKDGKFINLVFHAVRDEVMLKFEHMTLAEILEIIYSSGGRCITFRELEDYVDPDKAWEYTHPVVPASISGEI